MVKILFGGGCVKAVENECLKTTTIFDNDTFEFKEDSLFNVSRRGGQLHKIENNIFVIGGCEGYMKHLNSIEVYDNTNWNIVEDIKLPKKNSCFSSINITETSVLIFGGFNGFECLNDVCQVNNKDGTLKIDELPKLCTRLKNAAVGWSRENSKNVLLFGGWDEVRTLKTVFEYSLEKQKLFMYGLMSTSLEGHAVTNICSRNKLAIISGGYDGICILNTLFLYNFEDKCMKKLNVSLKIPRENHCAVYDDEKKLLYIINGWNGYEALNSIEIFEIIPQEPWLISKNEVFSPIKRNRPCSIML